MEKFLLGIDIGTSACKAALFDLDGNAVRQSAQSYKVYYPEPDYAEQNPDEWWNGVCKAVNDLISEKTIDAKQIAGIGIAGQSWSAIPIDKRGNVLYNTPIWMDTRASAISMEAVSRIGFDRIFQISGNSFEPTYSTPKILWFKQNRPDVYNSTFKFLQSNSYIAYKLTGAMAQDMSQGYGVHAFNIKTGKWDDTFCDELGIARDKLPEIYKCHEVIGEVTSDAAEKTGLAKGTPVVAGGLDAACGTLGAGVSEVGQTQEQGGQAGGMSICMDKALAHPKLILGYHVIPDLWLLQGGTVGGGGAIKWFRQELGTYEEAQEIKTSTNAFRIMDDEASVIQPGSDGLIFLPYMAGERSPIWDKNARGVIFGLGYSKTRAHMIRAVMEGCAYALHHNLKTAEDAGVGIKELISIGGAANSRLWTQMKSDITGKYIKVPVSDTATTLGAAILAGVGTGAYKSFRKAAERTIKITRIHEPDMKVHERYMRSYEIYIELYEKLKDTMLKSSNLLEQVY